MSSFTDFFPEGVAGGDGDSIGTYIKVPNNFIADGVNYVDTDSAIDVSSFPDLIDNMGMVSNWATAGLEQEINNPSPASGDNFGYSVSLYGDTLLVGALYEDIGASNAGSVYIYTRSGTTWILEQEINNPSPVADDRFGYSVSLYGDTLLVGAPFEDTGGTNVGSVYVYTRSGTTWTLEQEIHNPSPSSSDYFGHSVSLYGDTLLVGAYQEDTGASGSGSVYVYTRNGTIWTLEQEINNPTPASNDQFGHSVSLYGDTLLVGAQQEDTGASGSGSVYVYTRSDTTWTLEQEINNPSPSIDDNFGAIVSLYGDTLLVGAYKEDTGGSDTGSVYVYTRSGTTWTLEQEINNPSPVSYDSFGWSVSLYGDTLLVGAYNEDTGASGSGSVYVYTRSGTTWSLEQEINNPSPSSSDFFGNSVSLHGDTLLVGARNEDIGAASSTGSVYVYNSLSTATQIPAVTLPAEPNNKFILKVTK